MLIKNGGGKVAGSVSKNEPGSKYYKAKELGIVILPEELFRKKP